MELSFNVVFLLQVRRCDIYPNWYVVSEEDVGSSLNYSIIKSTEGDTSRFASSIDDRNSLQWGEYGKPFTPEVRYARNKDTADHGWSTKPVIPTPLHLDIDEESRAVSLRNGNWVIVQSNTFASVTLLLSSKLKNYLNFDM